MDLQSQAAAEDSSQNGAVTCFPTKCCQGINQANKMSTSCTINKRKGGSTKKKKKTREKGVPTSLALHNNTRLVDI